MRMTATRNALLTLGFTHNVQEPMKEVDAAEELAAMLREVCEAYWDGGDASTRAAVRKAEALLKKLTTAQQQASSPVSQ